MGEVQFNFSIPSTSPLFRYLPSRNSDATAGWNSSYTGSTTWPTQPRTAGLGTAFRRTSLVGATMQLDFRGTAVYLCYSAASDIQVQLLLDNTTPDNTTVSDPSICGDDYQLPSALAIQNLGNTDHLLILTVSAVGTVNNGPDAISFYGAMVTFSVSTDEQQSVNTTWVDDTNPGWSWKPGIALNDQYTHWNRTADQGVYNGTDTYSCGHSSTITASYTFTGTSAVWLRGYLFQYVHGFSITLDETTTVYDGTTSWEDGVAPLFLASGLDPTTSHTLTASPYSAADPNCSLGGGLCCLTLDALVLYQPTGGANSSGISAGSTGTGLPDNSSTGVPKPNSPALSTGAIVGIVIGTVQAILLVGLLVFFWRRRARRRRARPLSLNSVPPTMAEQSGPGRVSPFMDPGVVVTGNTSYSPSDPSPLSSPTRRRGGKGPMPVPWRESVSTGISDHPVSHPSRPPTDPSSERALPIGQQDLDRILEFVAQRIDTNRPGERMTRLPAYQEPEGPSFP